MVFLAFGLLAALEPDGVALREILSGGGYVPELTEGRVAIGALIAFAFWIFVALPILYAPAQQPQASGTTQQKSQAIAPPHVGRAQQAHTDPKGEPSEYDQIKPNHFLKWVQTFFEVKLTDALIAIFTIVLAVKTAGLFRETAGLRKAAEDRSLVEIYKGMSDIMTTQTGLMKIQSEINNATQRPRVNISKFEWDYIHLGIRGGDPNIAHQIAFCGTWLNNGGLPAMKVNNWMNGIILRGGNDIPLPPEFDFVPPAHLRGEIELFDLPRGQPMQGSKYIFDVDDLAEVQKGNACAYLWGYFEYGSSLKEEVRYQTTYCVRVGVFSDPGKEATKGWAQFSFHSTGRFTKAT